MHAGEGVGTVHAGEGAGRGYRSSFWFEPSANSILYAIDRGAGEAVRIRWLEISNIIQYKFISFHKKPGLR